jgi:hypothetical protein
MKDKKKCRPGMVRIDFLFTRRTLARLAHIMRSEGKDINDPDQNGPVLTKLFNECAPGKPGYGSWANFHFPKDSSDIEQKSAMMTHMIRRHPLTRYPGRGETQL